MLAAAASHGFASHQHHPITLQDTSVVGAEFTITYYYSVPWGQSAAVTRRVVVQADCEAGEHPCEGPQLGVCSGGWLKHVL